MSARIALTCTFCRAALVRGEAVFCAACLAPHHAECVREHGSCSAAGCGERRIVRPERRSRARRWCEVSVFSVLVVLVVLGAGVVLAQQEEGRELERRDAGQRGAIELLWRKLYYLEEDRRRRLAEHEVEEHFGKLVHLLQEGGMEELLEQFSRVRQAIDAAEYVVSEPAREAWKKRLGELGEGKRPPHLWEFVQDGNRALRQVDAAIEAEDRDRVDVGLRAIRGIVFEMRSAEREVFHRNADALEERARSSASGLRRCGRRALLPSEPLGGCTQHAPRRAADSGLSRRRHRTPVAARASSRVCGAGRFGS